MPLDCPIWLLGPRRGSRKSPTEAVASEIFWIDFHSFAAPFHHVCNHAVPERRRAQAALRRESEEERSVHEARCGEPSAQGSHGTRCRLAPVCDRDCLEAPSFVRLRGPQRQHEPFFFDSDVGDTQRDQLAAPQRRGEAY